MNPARRLAFVDVAKGVGILAVIALHSSGRSARVFAEEGDFQWWALVVFNRLMAFAVPMFFSVSAFLWARRASGKKPTAGSVWKRVASILYPYLVWTALYLVWNVYVDRSSAESVFGAKSLGTSLLWGKAYFHLYFMVVLMQAAIVFPLLFLIAVRGRFLLTCLVALLMQALVFLLQSKFEILRFPASTFLWYLTNILPAVWLGAHWPLSADKLRSLRAVSILLTVSGGGVYLWQQLLIARQVPVSSALANGSQQVYVFGASFALIAALALRESADRPLNRGTEWLTWLGAASLPLYLIHPMIMRLLGGPHLVKLLSKIPGAPILSYAGLLVVTILATLALRWAKVDKFLFGRVTPALPRVKAIK